MKVPGDLKYTKDHEWVRMNGSVATVGITEFAQSELGDIVFIDLPAIGKTVEKGGSLCVVESTKAASDVYAPVSGAVKEVNNKLGDTPGAINQKPYEDGWMVKIDVGGSKDFEGLLTSAQYEELLSSK